MATLTPEGQRIVDDASRRYSMSADGVRALLEALLSSGGGMAQFNHPDLGGMGQWSSGGMIMIGDMFNNELKNRISALCAELSDVIRDTGIVANRSRSGQWQSQSNEGSAPLPRSSFFVSGDHPFDGGDWWPSDLGMPASTGAQNNMRYAWFPDRRRLALDVDGQISVHDTGEHRITGFAQQQSGDQSLTFTSQHGVVRLDSLPRIFSSVPDFELPAERAGVRAGRVAFDEPTGRGATSARQRHFQQHRKARGPAGPRFHFRGRVLREEDRAPETSLTIRSSLRKTSVRSIALIDASRVHSLLS